MRNATRLGKNKQLAEFTESDEEFEVPKVATIGEYVSYTSFTLLTYDSHTAL